MKGSFRLSTVLTQPIYNLSKSRHTWSLIFCLFELTAAETIHVSIKEAAGVSFS